MVHCVDVWLRAMQVEITPPSVVGLCRSGSSLHACYFTSL